jgi:hypothetical protein
MCSNATYGFMPLHRKRWLTISALTVNGVPIASVARRVPVSNRFCGVRVWDLPKETRGGGVEVLLGLKPARVLYAGRSACCAGLDQIVIETPQGVEGCSVPIITRFAGDEADIEDGLPTVTVSSNANFYSDPQGLSEETLRRTLVVTWKQTGSPEDGLVRISGNFLTFRSDPNGYGLGGFTCLERASSGAFTVPSWLLWTWRSSPAEILELNITYFTRRAFSAPGLDHGEFVHTKSWESARKQITQ